MIREQIIKARKEQGLTQTDLALKAGLRQATISDFETGKKNLRSDLIEKIIQTLNLDIMNIIEEKKLQLELSGKIAKELISKGVEDVKPLTRETIHMMTSETCGDYILNLPVVSEKEYEKYEKRNEDYKTWNMFHTLLKLDFVYAQRTAAR